MAEYQTEELRSGASLILEDAKLQVAFEELLAKRNEEKAGDGLTPETQAAMQEAMDKIRAMRQYWRGIREYFEDLAAENAPPVSTQLPAPTEA